MSEKSRLARMWGAPAAAEPPLYTISRGEHERARLVDELDGLRARKERQVEAATIGPEQVRALLRRLFRQIEETAADETRRAEARQVLTDVVERIELDPATLAARVHYAVATGDKVASPRGSEQSPVRWSSVVIQLDFRRPRRVPDPQHRAA